MSGAGQPGASDAALAAARVERIRALVQDRLQPLRLEIRDDSAAHAGHAGGGGKGHFRLVIVAPCFSGRTLVQRHRLVHDALAELLVEEIHALALVTKAPEEVA
jgi:BolA family transcriptional regulator, general stress-responsive regulator